MSSSRTTTTRNTVAAAAAATPYCKVCRDAGKPESEYTSHFVKDQPGPDGKVVCPTLLNQACRICHKTGHTSSYCPQYNARRREREEPRREDYRREERYIPREEQPRREDYRREERYIAREEPRRDSYDRLRQDTERREREIRERDEAYYREQDRRSKPWLQAVMKKQQPEEDQPRRRHQPYAHPHGPRVRLNLESPALSAASVIKQQTPALPAIDVRTINLQHTEKWGDEDNEQPFNFANPEKMATEFFNELTTEQEDQMMAEFDKRSMRMFLCGCSDDEH